MPRRRRRPTAAPGRARLVLDAVLWHQWRGFLDRLPASESSYRRAESVIDRLTAAERTWVVDFVNGDNRSGALVELIEREFGRVDL